MKNPFSAGDVKIFRHVVTAEDTPSFEGRVVHPVYSTYALARDVEWAGRLFVLEMKNDDEEGIGTAINIQHYSPAKPGEEVVITSKLIAVLKNEIITSFEVRVEARLVASGETRQKILKKEKLDRLFSGL